MTSAELGPTGEDVRVILFDLGQTLEDDGELMPGALETLEAIQRMRADGEMPVLALISNYYVAETKEEIEAYQQQYFQLLADLNLGDFFTPMSERVTLSTEIGIEKPDERIFRLALDKIKPGLPFEHAIFITEDSKHIEAARALGLVALHVPRLPQDEGGNAGLKELLPKIERLLVFAPCGRKTASRSLSPVRVSKKLDPFITPLIAQVDAGRLRQTVTDLVQFGTRWSYSPQIAQVPEWVHDQFVGLGYEAGTETRYQEFELPGGKPQRNVLCGLPVDSGIVLVCAHYDSVSEKASTSAPGADDNGSGIAALIELARILKAVPLSRGVIFVAFGAEEQGLFGSVACAELAVKDHWPINLVLNMDMISYKENGNEPRIVVEYDQGNAVPSNDAASKAFGLMMAQAASDYTSLAVEHANIERSDYMPFEAKGFACIGAYNADENPFYHTTSDTLEKIDFLFFAEVVKMILATILKVCR